MSPPVNLYYIRAAIEANTGIRLSLKKTRQYLIEEGLISKDEDAHEFRGYSDYYWTDDASTSGEDPQEMKEDIDLAMRLMESNR